MDFHLDNRTRAIASIGNAVVWGASGGVGRALLEELVKDGGYGVIHAGGRRPIVSGAPGVRSFSFDLCDEGSIAAAAGAIAAAGPVDLTIVATGLLHSETHRPERSFAELTGAAMTALFEVNAVGPALIAKHMIAALPRDRRSVFAALSARVGSIGDNRLGGWHSYRASKAALNMIIANLAIELKRTHPHAIAIALHPGTVDTALSAPFQKGVAADRLFPPDISAQHLVSVIAGAPASASGTILAWDGQRIEP